MFTTASAPISSASATMRLVAMARASNQRGVGSLDIDPYAINASGETSRSLEYKLTDDGIQILGAPYFAERTEVGRTPTKHHQSFDFTSIIEQWIKDKGLDTEWGLNEDRDLRKVAGAIAHTISTRGSQKYREPDKQTDVYSSVIIESVDILAEMLLTGSGERLLGAVDTLARADGDKVSTTKIK